MDEAQLIAAVRYVNLDPVRARFIARRAAGREPVDEGMLPPNLL